MISRGTVIVVAVVAYLIALDPNSSIMGLVSNAWAGLGAAFGPTIVLSLFWKRTNLAGAVAGIVSGGATVILWDYIPLAGGQTLGAATGLYSLVVGFAISLLLIVVFSLMTKAPDEEMLRNLTMWQKKGILSKPTIGILFAVLAGRHPGDCILEPQIFPKFVCKSCGWHHLPGDPIFGLKGTAYSGAGRCFVDNWRAFLVEMKSSAYGNLVVRAFPNDLVVVGR